MSQERIETASSDGAVTEILTELDDLDQRPLREHVEVFESVHRQLQERFAQAEE